MHRQFHSSHSDAAAWTQFGPVLQFRLHAGEDFGAGGTPDFNLPILGAGVPDEPTAVGESADCAMGNHRGLSGGGRTSRHEAFSKRSGADSRTLDAVFPGIVTTEDDRL